MISPEIQRGPKYLEDSESSKPESPVDFVVDLNLNEVRQLGPFGDPWQHRCTETMKSGDLMGRELAIRQLSDVQNSQQNMKHTMGTNLYTLNTLN